VLELDAALIVVLDFHGLRTSRVTVVAERDDLSTRSERGVSMAPATALESWWRSSRPLVAW